MMNDKIELAHYFMYQGIHVVALTPNKKYPNYKDWNNKRLTIEQLERAIKKGYGLGLVPHGDFVVVDLDSDHDSGDGVTAFTDTFPDAPTLTAIKPHSPNQHRFYKNNLGLKVRKTGNNAIMNGVDIFTHENLITTLPFYTFIGLDYSRPFLDQLQPSPAMFERLRVYETHHQPTKQPTNRKHNIANYLAKVQPFDIGSRSSSYRRLMFILTQKNGMDYDEVFEAIVKWDRETINYQAEDSNSFFHSLRQIK